MRYFNLAVLLAVIAVIAMAGFRGHKFHKPPFEIFPDMNYQPKVKDQQPSTFFADGMASRQPVDGTIAEEMPPTLDYWASGKFDATHWGDGIPVHAAKGDEAPLAVDEVNIARGQERYNITCAACHGAAGDGKGITSQYGINATSYQSDRIRNMSDGEIFNTISNGKGQMAPFGYNISIDDRWRIIMYLRALQHAQNAQLQEAAPAEQQQLNDAKNKKTTSAKPLQFRPYQISYLDQYTVVAWYDGHQVKVKLQTGTSGQPSGIKYLNQKTVRGWDDSLEPQFEQ